MSFQTSLINSTNTQMTTKSQSILLTTQKINSNTIVIFIFSKFHYFIDLINEEFLKETSDCGITIGCFLSPSNCEEASCQFIYKYTTDANNTYFSLHARVESANNSWLAIGFSLDQAMVNKTTLKCKFYDQKVSFIGE